MSEQPSDLSQNHSGNLVPVAQDSLMAVSEHPPNSDKPEEQHFEELAREVLELKLDYLSEADNRDREIQRLRSQVTWSIGLLVGAIAIFASSFTWLFYNLKLEPDRLAQQIQAVKIDRQELTSLKSEVQSLHEQLSKTLAGDLKANQDKLTEIETQIQTLKGLETEVKTLENRVNTRQQAVAALVQALQEIVKTDNGATPPNSSEQSNQN